MYIGHKVLTHRTWLPMLPALAHLRAVSASKPHRGLSAPAGEPPQNGIIASITQGESTLVYCVEEDRLGFSEGDLVSFSELRGMQVRCIQTIVCSLVVSMMNQTAALASVRQRLVS